MTEHPTVRLVIRLYRGTRRDKVTLVRDVPMGHLPGIGEEIAVTQDEDFLLAVTRRHWAFEGQAIVYLRDVFIDPDPADTHIYADEMRWLTRQEEQDPMDVLRESGWANE